MDRRHLRFPALGQESDAPGRVRVTGPLTLVEVANLYQCSRANIWFIEQRALRKIRRAMELESSTLRAETLERD